MSRSVLYMSMSLDGFITGPDDGPDNGLGTGGERLHEWLFDGDQEVRGSDGLPIIRTSSASLPVVHEMLATGAVVTGRRTFEAAGGWGGDHHDGGAHRGGDPPRAGRRRRAQPAHPLRH